MPKGFPFLNPGTMVKTPQTRGPSIHKPGTGGTALAIKIRKGMGK